MDYYDLDDDLDDDADDDDFDDEEEDDGDGDGDGDEEDDDDVETWQVFPDPIANLPLKPTLGLTSGADVLD